MSMIARWHEFWHVVGSTAYGLAMPRGSIETLRTGFRARVYAGKDPITGKQTYLCGETRRHRRDAEADAERLVAAVEAERAPRAAQTAPWQVGRRCTHQLVRSSRLLIPGFKSRFLRAHHPEPLATPAAWTASRSTCRTVRHGHQDA